MITFSALFLIWRNRNLFPRFKLYPFPKNISGISETVNRGGSLPF